MVVVGVPNSASSQRLIMLAVVIVIGAVSCGCFVTGGSECERPPDSRLDGYRDDDDARRLVGLSRDEVVQMIGEPTTERFSPEWDMSYWLRPRGLCMDGWYLVVQLDEAERVTEARLLPG